MRNPESHGPISSAALEEALDKVSIACVDGTPTHRQGCSQDIWIERPRAGSSADTLPMRSVLAAALVCLTLGGCGNARTPVSTPVPRLSASATAQVDVFPEVLRNTQTLELGQLILLLVPDRNASFVGWDFRADSPIQWQTTAAYREVPESGYASRTGWVRVNVEGATATILRERKFEFGWTVEYSNRSSGLPAPQPQFLAPKLGVGSIEIKPGGEGELTCFGTGFEGCDFDEPLASLVHSGIHVQTICSVKMRDGHVSAFLLTHPAHKPTVMIWTRSGGSGGVGAWITLKLDADLPIPPAARTPTDPTVYEAHLCASDD